MDSVTELCTVKKIKRGIAYIELTHTDKCDGCNMCSFNRHKSITVPATCDIAVTAGSRVVVEMPTKSVGAGSLSIYIIPIALMVIGALIGLVGGVWLQIGLCGGGLALGLMAAYLIDRAYRRRPGVLPKVLRIAQERDERFDALENDEQVDTKAYTENSE